MYMYLPRVSTTMFAIKIISEQCLGVPYSLSFLSYLIFFLNHSTMKLPSQNHLV